MSWIFPPGKTVQRRRILANPIGWVQKVWKVRRKVLRLRYSQVYVSLAQVGEICGQGKMYLLIHSHESRWNFTNQFQAIKLLKIDQIPQLFPKLRILEFTNNPIAISKKVKADKSCSNNPSKPEMVVVSVEQEIRFEKRIAIIKLRLSYYVLIIT